MFRKKIFSRHDLLLENDTAYSCGGHSISFSDFHEFSENIAGFLHSNGTAPVIICGHKSPLMLCGKSVAKPYGFAQNTGFKLVGRKEYYFTGDIGYISDGLFFITGRDDCQIKYKGYRIELDDIESNLCKIDGVKQALVIADTDISGEVISLSCYISCDGEMNSQQIRKSANNLLPSYMIPKNIIFLESLPLTSRGKIDRRKVALVHGNNN